jgi:NDP-sugar pyrophosphorylase family protein
MIIFKNKLPGPRSNCIFSELLCAGPGFFNLFPSSMPADIAFHVLPRLLGKMRAYPITDYLLDIGTLPNYQEAQTTWPGTGWDTASPDLRAGQTAPAPRSAGRGRSLRSASSGETS